VRSPLICAFVCTFGGALLAGCHRPQILATTGEYTRLVGAYRGRVYWVDNAEGSLSFIDDDLERPSSIQSRDMWPVRDNWAPEANWPARGNFAADASGIYFSDHEQMRQLTVRDNTEKLIWGQRTGDDLSGAATDGDCVDALHADADCHDQGRIVAFAKRTGHTCTGRPVPANGQRPQEFRMDADYFYWIDGWCSEERPPRRGVVKAAPRRAGSAVIVAAADPAGPHDLAIGARGLYWLVQGEIHFVSKGTFGTPTTLVGGGVDSLAVDREAVFYAAADGVYWLSAGVSEPRRIARAQRPTGLVADDRWLYWAIAGTETDMRIVHMRRPD
jgi:hypothetical protein